MVRRSEGSPAGPSADDDQGAGIRLLRRGVQFSSGSSVGWRKMLLFALLAAGSHPNFRTISDFRKIHLKTLEGLFEQVLQIALGSRPR